MTRAAPFVSCEHALSPCSWTIASTLRQPVNTSYKNPAIVSRRHCSTPGLSYTIRLPVTRYLVVSRKEDN
jgi:hypothetical protein